MERYIEEVEGSPSAIAGGMGRSARIASVFAETFVPGDVWNCIIGSRVQSSSIGWVGPESGVLGEFFYQPLPRLSGG